MYYSPIREDLFKGRRHGHTHIAIQTHKTRKQQNVKEEAVVSNFLRSELCLHRMIQVGTLGYEGFLDYTGLGVTVTKN